MKKLLDIGKAAREFLPSSPTKADEDSYRIVKCPNILHFFEKKQYEELISKMCFLCGKTLVLDVKVQKSKSEMENRGFGFQPIMKAEEETVITTTRLKRVLNWNGFIIKKKTPQTGGIVQYIAEQMPKVKWDKKKELYDYPLDTIVEVPYLTHPHWKNYWGRVLKPGTKNRAWWDRVRELAGDFKIWLFQPVWYCKECQRQHQGAHRLMVAKVRGLKTINILIMRHFWSK